MKGKLMDALDLPEHYAECIAEVAKMIPCLESLLPADHPDTMEILTHIKKVVHQALAVAEGRISKEDLNPIKLRLGELKRESPLLIGAPDGIVEAAFQIGAAIPDSSLSNLRKTIERLKTLIVERLEDARALGTYHGPRLD